MTFGVLEEKIDLEKMREQNPKYRADAPPCRLVVACMNGHGCVLHWIGEAWEYWRDGCGTEELAAQGMDDAPDGISIWEGTIHTWGPDRDGEYDAEPVGEFRDLTPEEWKMLAEGSAPWNEKEWLAQETSCQ